MRALPCKILIASAFVTSILTGCGATSVSPGAATSFVAAVAGVVHGGQQPISRATILLYAAGLSGTGTGATNLLTVPVATASDGSFNLTGSFTCPGSRTQVYLVAQGGNPGLSAGTNNTAILQMAALGDCGNLGPGTYINVNEITTVGAAWALSRFLGPGANVGASSTNTVGLRNAFANAANLVNTASGSTPGASLPAGATVESAKIVTLADAIAPCVNSDGGSPCTALFAAATNGSVAPSNTLDAALQIVRNPGAHLADVFNLTSALSPFQPTLPSTPADWTMSVTYSGGGLNLPTALGVDAGGNVWVGNYFGGAVSEFTTTGTPLTASGFPGPLRDVYGLTIDSSNNVWVASEDTPYAVNQADGSLTVFNQAGQVISGTGFTGGGVFYPVAAAADPNGNIWIANYGRSSATLLSNTGAAISPSTGYGGSSTPFPLAVAVDTTHNAWLAVEGGAVKIAPDGTLASYTCCGNPSGIAVDQGGNVWISDYYASRLVELSPAGAVLRAPTKTGGLLYPQGIAIDGAGAVWATNYRGSSVTQLAGYASAAPDTALSPAAGYGTAAGMVEAFGIAFDPSGNVWVTSAGTNQLVEIVGAATPIKTPLLGPPQLP